MGFVAGIDGGGTKTECVLLDAEGRLIRSGLAGSLNLNSRPQAEVAQSLHSVVQMMLAQGEACRMLCIGCAGMSNPELSGTLERMLRAEGYEGPCMFVGDQAAALYAAHGEAPGAVLISGTGSICFGRNGSGDTARAGGWGYKISDGGSGYAIGRDILSAVVRAHDGCGRPTVLKERVLAQFGTHDLEPLIHALYTEGEKQGNPAAYAPLLPAAVAEGDAVACDILQKAIAQLCQLASAVVLRLGLQESRLALSGGILKNIACVAEGVTAHLHMLYPHLEVFVLKTSAAEGAARMALAAVERGVEFLK